MAAGYFEAKNLVKRFGGVVAVNRLSFSLRKSEILGLIGPNGSGKSTLLRLILGLLKPDFGRVIFKGEDITALPVHKRVAKGITGTFQHVRPLRGLSVLENVLASALVATIRKGQTNKVAERRARELLELVGINHDKILSFPNSLSHGDLKKLEIARALATEPELLLLDEPFAGLNLYEIQEIAELLKDLRSHGLTIIIVEHKLPELMKLVNRVIVLNFGEIIADGSPEEVAKNKKVIEVYIGTED